MKKIFSFVILFFCIFSYGAVTVTVNGSNYSIPQTNERGWGTAVTNWIQAISSNTLQPVGGSFTLTNDVDFGASYGLKSSYILSRNSNPATAGLLRLNVTDYIGWRNNANSGNLLLAVNASDKLTFNGSPLLVSGSVLNADINASAAIDASKIADGSVNNTKFQYLNTLSSNAQTQLDSKVDKSTLTTKGDIYVATASATVTRQGIGSDGQVLTADSGQTNGLKWATPSSNPVTTKGDLAGYDTAANRVPVGSNNQFLMADSGSSLGLKWQPFFPPNIQKFTSGSGTYTLGYAFLISSGSATAGATYTNNGNTYTVLGTVSSSTLIYLSGSSDPTSSGTLTKASGTGDASLTFSAASKSKYIRVRMVGAGGGGGASATGGSPSSGGTGGNTTFGTSLLTANGGTGGTLGTGGGGGNPGNGGTASISSPAVGTAISGGGGGSGSNQITVLAAGGNGGNTMFGGAGSGGLATAVSPTAAATNSGSGGGGAGSASGASSGGGGGSGGSIDAIINNPSSTYSYAIGAAGSAGAAGTGTSGAGGAAGYIEVTEYYQ